MRLLLPRLPPVPVVSRALTRDCVDGLQLLDQLFVVSSEVLDGLVLLGKDVQLVAVPEVELSVLHTRTLLGLEVVDDACLFHHLALQDAGVVLPQLFLCQVGAQGTLVDLVLLEQIAEGLVLVDFVALLPALDTDLQVLEALALGVLPPQGLVQFHAETFVYTVELVSEVTDALGAELQLAVGVRLHPYVRVGLAHEFACVRVGPALVRLLVAHAAAKDLDLLWRVEIDGGAHRVCLVNSRGQVFTCVPAEGEIVNFPVQR